MEKQYHFWNFFDNAEKLGIANAFKYDLEKTLIGLEGDPLEPKTLTKNILKLPINAVLLTLMFPIVIYHTYQKARKEAYRIMKENGFMTSYCFKIK